MFFAQTEKRIPKKGSSLPDITFHFSSSPPPPSQKRSPSKKPKSKRSSMEADILKAFFARSLPSSSSCSEGELSEEKEEADDAGGLPKERPPSICLDLKGKKREEVEVEAEPEPPCLCDLHPPSDSIASSSTSSYFPPCSTSSTSSSSSIQTYTSSLNYDHLSFYQELEFYEDQEAEDWSSYTLYEEADQWETELGNSKHAGAFLRSTNKNKHPRINPDRYVNSRDQKRKEDLESFISTHCQAIKFNRSILLARQLSLLNDARKQGRRGGTTFHPFSQTKRSSRRSRFHGNQGAGGNGQQQGQYIDSRELQAMARRYGVTPQIMEEIQKLQWKPNLTPEDYELLILLDQAVAPKTVAKGTVAGLPKRVLMEGDFGGEKGVDGLCPICISPYMVGEAIKTLPCGHFFHSQCIEYWLTNSSTRCPTDGLAVFD